MESRFVDWTEAFRTEEWKSVGRHVMEEKLGEWTKDNPDGIEVDDYFPMYNYAYPLKFESDEYHLSNLH